MRRCAARSCCPGWDLYSGVKVAQTSTPSADQAMMNSHTSATLTPPHWLLASAQWTLWECQSPASAGPRMRNPTGIISSAPVTYVNHANGRTPKMLKSHTTTMQPMPMKLNSCRCTTPSHTVHVELENHCAWISPPIRLPKIASTTDQPIQ